MASEDLSGPDEALAWSAAGIMLALSRAGCDDARQDLADLIVNALGPERGVRVLDRACGLECIGMAEPTEGEAANG